VAYSNNKYVGLPGTAVYPHMPILCDVRVARAMTPSVGDATDSSDFGLLWSTVPQNGIFSAQDAVPEV